MLKLGQYNYLQISHETAHGIYLNSDSEYGQILLPNRYKPRGFSPDDWIEVFVYLDSEDRPIATTLKPKVQVGQFASLKVIDTNRYGAFLDWGLEKDLMVPYQEQIKKLRLDQYYMVYVYLDKNTKRITATTKIDKYLKPLNQGHFKEGQTVNIQIWRKTEIGYSMIIENSHLGMVYSNEIFQKLRYGQKLKAFIKTIRDDDKIDVRLNKTADKHYQELPDIILAYLKEHDGICTITDKSPPEEIYDTFAVSKGNFKKAVGNLYKLRKISLEKGMIRLMPDKS